MIGRHTVQPATRGQAAAIAAMSRDLIERGLGWSWTLRRVIGSIDDPATNVVVATDGGRLLGFAIMKYRDDDAHLLLLAVQSAVARRGVGRSLVDWLEASALAAGIGQVCLEARAGNASARRFYRRLGYREVQHLPGYYHGEEAAVRLDKDLWAAPAASG